jgi:hypothetical protein
MSAGNSLLRIGLPTQWSIARFALPEEREKGDTEHRYNEINRLHKEEVRTIDLQCQTKR